MEGEAGMIVEIADHLVDQQGRTVFTALVKVEEDGRLLVMVPIADTEDDNEPAWLVETLGCDEARSFAAILGVKGTGGGVA